MAITNAQQYQQLVNKPANGKRPGYRGDAAYRSASEQSKSIGQGNVGSKASFGGGKGRDRSGRDEGAGGADRSAVGPGSTYARNVEKQKEKKNILDIFNPFSKNRKKLAYNASMLIPGQKARSAKYQKAYRDYLISMGVTPPDTLTGEEDDLADFFVNNAFDKPVAADANVQPPQSYGDFLLENFGAPGVKFSGNVGGKEVYVKGTRPDGSKIYDVREERGGGRDDFILPVSQPVASIPEPTGYVNPLSLLTPRIAGTRFLGTEFEDEEDTEFAANGGRIGAMGGGIMNTDVMGGLADGGMDESGRQMYFLGKLVKKATRAVKKLVKSPIGKAALIGAGFGFAGMGPFKGLAGSKFGLGLKNFMAFGNPDKAFDITGKGFKLGQFIADNPYKTIGGISLLAPLLAGKQEDDNDELAKYLASQKLDPATTARQMGSEFDFYKYNLAEGGMPSKEPVAKKTMPLLDMDGQEMDLRAEGGFVPIGRMERADDVPARLSKNEFVFTADAVRNAGEGDIDKGAEVMYNMMKNLESGGEVSEESQGLNGAREMFQTSKRLEEVL